MTKILLTILLSNLILSSFSQDRSVRDPREVREIPEPSSIEKALDKLGIRDFDGTANKIFMEINS